jgi:uncharacterized membrane protein YqgA involved in biofilm formation
VTGTIINVAAVILGSLVGLLVGNRIPEKTRQTLISVMGLYTLAYGVFIFTKTQNMLIPLLSLVMGTIIGELLKIEEGLNSLGERIQRKLAIWNPNLTGESQKFVTGFVSASLLFCIGPMAILGSIQDGISGDFQMLAIKSLLDGIGSIAFASTLGVGVMFSAVVILVYQGAISLLSGWIGQGFGDAAVAEMTATGGVILVGIGISNLLQIKKIHTGSFLPAIFIAVLIVLLLNALGVTY